MKKHFKRLICVVSCLAMLSTIGFSVMAYVVGHEVINSQWEYYNDAGQLYETNHISYTTIYAPEGQTVVCTGSTATKEAGYPWSKACIMIRKFYYRVQ